MQSQGTIELFDAVWAHEKRIPITIVGRSKKPHRIKATRDTPVLPHKYGGSFHVIQTADFHPQAALLAFTPLRAGTRSFSDKLMPRRGRLFGVGNAGSERPARLAG